MKITGKQLSEAFAVLNKATTIINAPGVSEQDVAKTRSLALTAIEALQQIIARVGNVEDIVGQAGTPCPVQSQYVIGYIRSILGIEAHKEVLKESVPAKGSHEDKALTLGKGPFRAAIVTGAGTLVWLSDKPFKTEREAEQAIVAQAKKRKHRTTPWASHWITSKKEHMLDYGSYSYYGRITKGGSVKR